MVELREDDLGVTARWDGGVTAVLVDDSNKVLGRQAVGDAPTRAEIDVVLRALIRSESERQRATASKLRSRAQGAIQRSWMIGGERATGLRRSQELRREGRGRKASQDDSPKNSA